MDMEKMVKKTLGRPSSIGNSESLADIARAVSDALGALEMSVSSTGTAPGWAETGEGASSTASGRSEDAAGRSEGTAEGAEPGAEGKQDAAGSAGDAPDWAAVAAAMHLSDAQVSELVLARAELMNKLAEVAKERKRLANAVLQSLAPEDEVCLS
jgi:hypothetical protein